MITPAQSSSISALFVSVLSPVDDNDYKVPFHFTGKIDKVTIKLGPPQLTADDQKTKEEVVAHVNN